MLGEVKPGFETMIREERESYSVSKMPAATVTLLTANALI